MKELFFKKEQRAQTLYGNNRNQNIENLRLFTYSPTRDQKNRQIILQSPF